MQYLAEVQKPNSRGDTERLACEMLCCRGEGDGRNGSGRGAEQLISNVCRRERHYSTQMPKRNAFSMANDVLSFPCGSGSGHPVGRCWRTSHRHLCRCHATAQWSILTDSSECYSGCILDWCSRIQQVLSQSCSRRMMTMSLRHHQPTYCSSGWDVCYFPVLC